MIDSILKIIFRILEKLFEKWYYLFEKSGYTLYEMKQVIDFLLSIMRKISYQLI